jgi:type II secretory pathway component PulF
MVNFPYRRRKLQNLVSGLEPMHVIILGLLIATVGVGWHY